MECIKTGAHVYLGEYSEYVYGDVYAIGDCYVVRAVERSYEALGPMLHFTFNRTGRIWKDGSVMTVCAVQTGNIDHGYEGISCKD